MTFAPTLAVVLEPLIAWPVLIGTALLALGLAVWLAMASAPAWLSRVAGMVLGLVWLANPVLIKDVREPLPDHVVVVVDTSRSMDIDGRKARAAVVAANLQRDLATLPDVVTHIVEAPETDGVSAMLTQTRKAMLMLPEGQVAGAILVTDGAITDDVPALDFVGLGPVNIAQVARTTARDHRLDIVSAPRFGVVGDEVSVVFKVAQTPDSGKPEWVDVDASLDGAPLRRLRVQANAPNEITFPLKRRGVHWLSLQTPTIAGELTARNNTAFVDVTAVRDRLRIMLITGSPNASVRTWRDLLKSDPAIDLVHFTILRTGLNLDGTPDREMSLIPFPTDALFLDRLKEFDLVIFDQFRNFGILPDPYFHSIVDYVEGGGALMTVFGADDLNPDGIHFTPLATILPARPGDRAVEGLFRPAVTNAGLRHPLSAALASGPAPFGRWARYVPLAPGLPQRGTTLLAHPNGAPLLIADRAGNGRVLELLTDQAWLWARGYDGGGPHQELIRRSIHWLMDEPELREERLTVSQDGSDLRFSRVMLGNAPPPDLAITFPNGTEATTAFTPDPTKAGAYSVVLVGAGPGFYQGRSGDRFAAIAIGAANGPELSDLAPRSEALRRAIRKSGGVLVDAYTVMPKLGFGTAGAGGNDTFRLVRNKAFRTLSQDERPLLPGWAYLVLVFLLLAIMWRRESR